MTYKIVTSADPNPAKLEPLLNKLAADGYRVVAVFSTVTPQAGFSALLEKNKDEASSSATRG